MEKVISLRAVRYEKQYRDYYKDINNYNRSLMMVGTAPKSQYEFFKSKIC